MAHQKKRDADYIVKGNGEILSRILQRIPVSHIQEKELDKV